MKNKDILIKVFVYFLLIACVACKKDKNNEVQGPNPVITGISPATGTKGTIVTIKGSGFEADVSNIIVLINGKVSAVLEASATEIKFAVPPRTGTGLVAVDVNGKTASGPLFTYIYTVEVSTYSGTPGVSGFANGAATSALFNNPRGLTIDAIGNLYVADELNHRIRRISPGGSVVTFAGIGIAGHLDGASASARFNHPFDVEVDHINGFFYVADMQNHCIRRISNAGQVTTAAGIPGSPGYVDGPGNSARLNEPTGVAVEGELINLFIADANNHCIRVLNHLGVITTFAGSNVTGSDDGFGTGAKFNFPSHITWDSAGYLFVADRLNNNVRRINKSTTEVITVAGNIVAGYVDGPGNAALFNAPVAVAAWNNQLVVCDQSNHILRAVSSSKNVTTLAGSGNSGFLDGAGPISRFNQPGGIVRNSDGDYFVSDTQNHCIRKVVVD